MFADSPILAQAQITQLCSKNYWKAQLKNGAQIIVHPDKSLSDLSLVMGDFVVVEMTPFDFTKGRIIQKISPLP